MEINPGVSSGSGGVESISKFGSTPLTGDVTLSAGSNVTLTQVGQDIQVSASGGSGSDSYETVSQNLVAYDYTITYTVNGDIDHIEYDLGGGLTITKTFAYSSGDITDIVLSGDTPGGITLTKTFTYSSGDITAVEYS